MVFQDWRLPSVVTGERRRWVKLVAELLPPTFHPVVHAEETLCPFRGSLGFVDCGFAHGAQHTWWHFTLLSCLCWDLCPSSADLGTVSSQCISLLCFSTSEIFHRVFHPGSWLLSYQASFFIPPVCPNLTPCWCQTPIRSLVKDQRGRCGWHQEAKATRFLQWIWPFCTSTPVFHLSSHFALWGELHPLQESCVIRRNLQLQLYVPVVSSKCFHLYVDVFRKCKHLNVPLNIFCCSLAFDKDTSRRLVGKRNILKTLPSNCNAELWVYHLMRSVLSTTALLKI